MSVVGIDFGNSNSVVAVARNRGIDIVCNEVSNRATPTLVSFGPKNRFIGESAKTQEISNFRNTISSLKRLLGRGASDSEIQTVEAKYLSCSLDAKDGLIASKVNFQGEDRIFGFTELTSMYLAKLKDITQKEVKTAVSDVVISVPIYYTDSQRRALLDACGIAGLNCLRLLNDTTASALAYGITKTDLPEDAPRYVCFVDMGHAGFSVSIVAYTKGKLEVKATAVDRHLGGRDFDEILVDHFVEEIKARNHFDVRSNPKALFRLRGACERVKKVLSANTLTHLHVENLMEDQDISAEINRSVFESIAAPLIARIQAPLAEALQIVGITADQLYSIEAVGGSLRIPAVKEQIVKFFGRDLSHTLNQDEAIARGCALQCAILSPVFKVREFAVHEVTSFPIKFTWEPTPEDPEDREIEVFSLNNQVPSTKLLSFKRPLPFEIQAAYSDPSNLPVGTSCSISNFIVNAPKESISGTNPTIKVKTRLDVNGIVHVPGATLSVEMPIVEETETEPRQVDVEKTVSTKKMELSVTPQTSSLPTAVINQLFEAEAAMEANDRLVADTADRKNALEEYIYDLRSKLDSTYADFIKESDREALARLLSKTEDWLYDEGEDSTKSLYTSKLEELLKMGKPAADRVREFSDRPCAEALLRSTIADFTALASGSDEKFSHIDKAERSKVIAECEKKLAWLETQVAKQAAMPRHEKPALTSAMLNAERENLVNTVGPIMNKPKPKVQPTSAPTPSSQPEQMESEPFAPKVGVPNMDVD